jgi:hypothetical protein
VSGTIGVREYLAMSDAQAQWAREELARVSERRAELVKTRHGTQEQRDATLARLTRLWLPSLDAAGLAHAGRRTRYRAETDPLARRDEDKVELGRALARIAAEPDYRDRERLLDPVVGELTLAAKELADARAPLDATWARLQHPRVAHLIEAEYGTPRYAVPWWRASYYSDWAAADEILERFPDKHTGDTYAFGALRDLYLQLRDAIPEHDARGRALEARRQRIARLADEHAQASEALRTLDERHLEVARREVADAAALLDAGMLARRNADAPELEGLVKRWKGLEAKLGYLDEMERSLDTLSNDLRGRIAKAGADRAKYARPKKAGTRFPRDKVEHRFRDRSASSQKHWERFDRGHDRMRDFDAYDRVSFASDFLWWDHMTNGCHAPHLVSVSSFHSHHPGYRWQGWNDADAAAAIASAPERHDLGHDAS